MIFARCGKEVYSMKKYRHRTGTTFCNKSIQNGIMKVAYINCDCCAQVKIPLTNWIKYSLMRL